MNVRYFLRYPRKTGNTIEFKDEWRNSRVNVYLSTIFRSSSVFLHKQKEKKTRAKSSNLLALINPKKRKTKKKQDKWTWCFASFFLAPPLLDCSVRVLFWPRSFTVVYWLAPGKKGRKEGSTKLAAQKKKQIIKTWSRVENRENAHGDKKKSIPLYHFTRNCNNRMLLP